MKYLILLTISALLLTGCNKETITCDSTCGTIVNTGTDEVRGEWMKVHNECSWNVRRFFINEVYFSQTGDDSVCILGVESW